MKFFLCLGLFVTIFATGESVQCYACLEGNSVRNEQILTLIDEYNIQPPIEQCSKNNGTIIGPQCNTPYTCVEMDVIANTQRTVYHFCSNIYKSESVRSFSHSSGNDNVKANFNHCSQDLCNGRITFTPSSSSIIKSTPFVILSLVISSYIYK